MKFAKIHGAGNDFIIINNIDERIPIDELGELASALCSRRLSIGADGFMAVDIPEIGGDFKMHFYNGDGSRAEMCGNGARCVARYGVEKGLCGTEQRIETDSGMVYGRKINNSLYKIQLNRVAKVELYNELDILGKKISYSYLELGESRLPHIAVPIKGLQWSEGILLESLGALEDLKKTAESLRHHSSFTKGANVNFYDVVGKGEVRILTYERGVEDFTLACGTGAGATISALTLMGLVTGNDVKVMVPGGDLYITAIQKGKEIDELYLTGPTCFVAEGEIKMGSLKQWGHEFR